MEKSYRTIDNIQESNNHSGKSSVKEDNRYLNNYRYLILDRYISR